MHLSLLDECHGRAEQALDVLRGAASPDPRCEMKPHAALASSSWSRAARIYAQGIHELSAIWARALEMAESLGDAEYQLRSPYDIWAFLVGIDQLSVARERAKVSHDGVKAARPKRSVDRRADNRRGATFTG
jgi:hypothetical protein